MTMTGTHYGSYHFLTEILRQEWGFKGYVVSDSEAVEFISNKHKVADTYEDGIAQAVNAGLNIRTISLRLPILSCLFVKLLIMAKSLRRLSTNG